MNPFGDHRRLPPMARPPPSEPAPSTSSLRDPPVQRVNILLFDSSRFSGCAGDTCGVIFRGVAGITPRHFS